MLLLAAALCALPGQIQASAGSAAAAPYSLYIGGSQKSLDEALDTAARADVVFIGEEHPDPSAHRLEREVLEGLAKRKPRMALSMEMFERDVQGVVDEYLAGCITETQFLAASRPWPNYKTDYRPMIEFCKEHKLPVVAANTPRRYVNMVSRGGPQALAALPREAYANIPPIPYSTDIPEGYKTALTAIFSEPHGTAPTTSTGQAAAAPAMPGMPSAENLMMAQEFWDAGMADSIARFAKRHHGTAMLQVNGGMHSDNGYGIVARLKRLLPHARIVLISVKREASYPNLPAGGYPGVADIVAVSPAGKD